MSHTPPENIPPPPTATEQRKATVSREREAFGGVKVGSAFFGWLTATGMVVLLTAAVAAAGAGVVLTNSDDDVARAAADNGVSADQITWGGVIAVLVLVLVSYYAGGYVAGRMARFDGARQGVAVWLWAVVIAIVAAVVGAVVGSDGNVLDSVNAFPRIPDALDQISQRGWITIVGVLVISLVGAVLGGLAGMRFHRRVDKAGLGG